VLLDLNDHEDGIEGAEKHRDMQALAMTGITLFDRPRRDV